MSLGQRYQHLVLFIFFILLTSCYTYDGPTREKLSSVVRPPLAPPAAKVVGRPLSKSEYMGKAYQEIKSSLPEAEVQLIEDSIKVLFPNHIVYDNKADIPASDYKPALDQFVSLLKKYAKTNVLVTGHTDNRGDEQSNRTLSANRAKKISDYLQISGVKSYRLSSWGLGSILPIADNETPEGRARNRRVEFVVLYNRK